MQIAISASAPDLDAAPDPRFGRAPYFVLVDPETMAWQAFPNPAYGQDDYCAITAIKSLLAHQPAAVVSGHYGPKAIGGLRAAHIPAYLFESQASVQAAAVAFQAGALKETLEATVPGHHAASHTEVRQPVANSDDCLYR